MHIKEMMDKIIEKGDKQDMEHLSDCFIDMIYDLKDKDPIKYKGIVYEMQKIAYDGHLTEEQAKHWVDSMKNKDGSFGAHWSWQQTEEVKRQVMPNANCNDWYAVLNMMYSDYYSSRFDTNTYVELAKDWLDDDDVCKEKTLKYYLYVVK